MHALPMQSDDSVMTHTSQVGKYSWEFGRQAPIMSIGHTLLP